jgi:uncharacterized membrane protein YhaH (DUF805 family)
MPLIFTPLVKYADFHGRARRSEIGLFYLLNFIGTVICVGGGVIISRTTSLDGATLGFVAQCTMYFLFIVPWLALAARRLHDIDKSGWWLLIGLVPFAIVILVIGFFREGTVGDNQFGPIPKRARPLAPWVVRGRRKPFWLADRPERATRTDSLNFGSGSRPAIGSPPGSRRWECIQTAHLRNFGYGWLADMRRDRFAHALFV